MAVPTNCECAGKLSGGNVGNGKFYIKQVSKGGGAIGAGAILRGMRSKPTDSN